MQEAQEGQTDDERLYFGQAFHAGHMILYSVKPYSADVKKSVFFVPFLRLSFPSASSLPKTLPNNNK